ncbi:GNAT family N-acetyltransferase [Nocardia sp. NPDC049707]|uniref:GNAT family N-acetyltransferase n=1 Tax=Nocardia sp. NPDC049707 TaxID=3154735 RepID=UPI003437CBFE
MLSGPDYRAATVGRIRPYRPADEDVVVDLWARASRIAHPFVPGEGGGERERKMREIYLVQADNWVAEDANGRVVALLGMLGSEIGGLFVHPDAQGAGIGRVLVEFAAARHDSVTLDVYENNHKARGFYTTMGFAEEGRHPDEDSGHMLITLRRPGHSTAAAAGAPHISGDVDRPANSSTG